MGRIQKQGNRSAVEDQCENRRGASGKYDEKDARIEHCSAAENCHPRRNDQDSVGFFVREPDSPRCLTASKSATATAAAHTFKASTFPFIGILTRSSHC